MSLLRHHSKMSAYLRFSQVDGKEAEGLVERLRPEGQGLQADRGQRVEVIIWLSCHCVGAARSAQNNVLLS